MKNPRALFRVVGIAVVALAALALSFFGFMWIRQPYDKPIWIPCLGISFFALMQGLAFLFMANRGRYKAPLVTGITLSALAVPALAFFGIMWRMDSYLKYLWIPCLGVCAFALLQGVMFILMAIQGREQGQ